MQKQDSIHESCRYRQNIYSLGQRAWSILRQTYYFTCLMKISEVNNIHFCVEIKFKSKLNLTMCYVMHSQHSSKLSTNQSMHATIDSFSRGLLICLLLAPKMKHFNFVFLFFCFFVLGYTDTHTSFSTGLQLLSFSILPLGYSHSKEHQDSFIKIT